MDHLHQRQSTPALRIPASTFSQNLQAWTSLQVYRDEVAHEFLHVHPNYSLRENDGDYLTHENVQTVFILIIVFSKLAMETTVKRTIPTCIAMHRSSYCARNQPVSERNRN